MDTSTTCIYTNCHTLTPLYSLPMPPRPFPSPPWDGSDPAGRRILLHAEQGLGDAIQFARDAPLLARAGATVILACPDPLAALFTTLKGDPEIVAERAPPDRKSTRLNSSH